MGVITIGEEDLKVGSYSTMDSKPSKSEQAAEAEPPVAATPDTGNDNSPEAQPVTNLISVAEIGKSDFRSEVLRHRGQPVLVDFYATWCGPCKRLAPNVQLMATLHNEDLKVVRMDVDKNEDLRKQYKVDSFPTLVLFKNGREVKRTVGLYSVPQLKSLYEPLL